MLFWCAGCASNGVAPYAENKPVFNILDYFHGQVEVSGILEDYRGKVTRRFTATIKGDVQDKNHGSLDEVFYYDDGEIQKRQWQMHVDDKGNITATANDVVGKAQGKQQGNAAFLKYVLAVKTKSGSTWNISMDDRMFLMPDGKTVINKTIMRKWGIKVGELTIVLVKN